MSEVDIRIINGRKLQDVDLRKKCKTQCENANSRILALEEKIDPFACSVKVEPAIVEMGSVAKVKVSWEYNRKIVSQTVNKTDVIPGDRSKMFLNMIKNETFNVVGTRVNGEQASGYATLTFANGIYYGGSTTYKDFDSAWVMSLTNKVLSNERDRVIYVNPNTAGYIYYCTPKRLGKCYFSIEFVLIATIDFTNDSGFTEEYDIYRTPVTNLYDETIKVKGYYDVSDVKQDVEKIKGEMVKVKDYKLTCQLIDDDDDDVIIDNNYKISFY